MVLLSDDIAPSGGGDKKLEQERFCSGVGQDYLSFSILMGEHYMGPCCWAFKLKCSRKGRGGQVGVDTKGPITVSHQVSTYLHAVQPDTDFELSFLWIVPHPWSHHGKRLSPLSESVLTSRCSQMCEIHWFQIWVAEEIIGSSVVRNQL